MRRRRTARQALRVSGHPVSEPIVVRWVPAGVDSELADESAVHVELAGKPVCLARSNGAVYALLDECSHGQVALSEGDVEGGYVECWLHGSCFDLTTGVPAGPPATAPVPTFPVRVTAAGVIEVALPIHLQDLRSDTVNKMSLTALAREHAERARGASSGRSSHTVYGGHERTLRQTLLAMAAGQSLSEHKNPGEATLQVLSGRVRMTAGDTSWDGSAGDLLIIPDAVHDLEAMTDAVVLLTVAKLA